MRIRLLTPVLLLVVFFVLVPVPPSAHALLWSSPNNIDQHAGINILPNALQAANGTIWVAWQTNRYGTMSGRDDVVFKTKNPSGAWSSAHNLTSSSMNASPALVQLLNGTILAIWSSNPGGSSCSPQCNVYYERYNGHLWSSPTQLSSGVFNDSLSSASVSRNGTLWLVWSREIVNCSVSPCSDTRQLYYRTLKGNTWSPEAQLTSDNNWNWGASVAIGKDGIVRVVWSKGVIGVGDGQIYYKTFNGTAWSAETQIVTSTNVSDEHPSLVQDRNGTFWIFWARTVYYTSVDYHYVIFNKQSFNNGQNWSGEFQMTNTPNTVDSEMPSAIQSTVSSNRALWVFYSSNPSNEIDIWALMSTPVSPVHDVTISSISAAPGQGSSWTITVTVVDLGDYSELVSVSLTLTNTTSYNLGPNTGQVLIGGSTNIIFTWSPTSAAPGLYSATATVAPVPGETLGNQGDNTLQAANLINYVQPMVSIASGGGGGRSPIRI